MEDVRQKVESIEGKLCHNQSGFEPEWDKDMMSEEAKLELGFVTIVSLPLFLNDPFLQYENVYFL